jgi:NAD(P)H-dependent FMN reductase/ketosteroid isomerase-like protein
MPPATRFNLMEMAMSQTLDVAVLVGSLRKASLTRKVAKALIELAPDRLKCRLIDIGDLPMYNEDLDDEPPAPWTRFRKDIANADAIVFVTPEYNRSVPGSIKNALDVGSRPQGKSVWAGKPAAIASVTPYKLGAFGANHAIRQALVFLDVPAMQQPEAYIGGAAELFDDKDQLKNQETHDFLKKFMASFSQWATTLAAAGPGGDDFDEFLARREAIASAYSNGDAEPLSGIVATDDPATFFPPGGGSVAGADAVATRYRSDAESFAQGNRNALRILQSDASGGLAFWTGFQDFEGRIGGHQVKMTLRITELFRRQEDDWKLIHRHADQLAEPKSKD